MKLIKFTSTLCAARIALHGTAFAGGEGWISDFAAAKKQAAESKKDLLVDFTGSDWCGWCIKLNKEVFAHDAFKTGVKDTFVLVEIDFPKDKSKLSEATQKQNEELAEKYGVKGFPTILLCDAEGRPYAKTGYQKGGPESYVEHLNKLRETKTKRDEALASAETAKGVEKAKSLVAALEAMNLDEKAVMSFYGDIIEQIKAADPTDETGFGKKAATQKRLKNLEKGLQELAGKKDMDGAHKLVDDTIKEGGFETVETQQIMMTRAVIFAQQGKFEESLKAVDAAVAFAPDSPMVPGIGGFRKQIEGAMKKAEEKRAKKDAEPAGKE